MQYTVVQDSQGTWKLGRQYKDLKPLAHSHINNWGMRKAMQDGTTGLCAQQTSTAFKVLVEEHANAACVNPTQAGVSWTSRP